MEIICFKYNYFLYFRWDCGVLDLAFVLFSVWVFTNFDIISTKVSWQMPWNKAQCWWKSLFSWKQWGMTHPQGWSANDLLCIMGKKELWAEQNPSCPFSWNFPPLWCSSRHLCIATATEIFDSLKPQSHWICDHIRLRYNHQKPVSLGQSCTM